MVIEFCYKYVHKVTYLLLIFYVDSLINYYSVLDPGQCFFLFLFNKNRWSVDIVDGFKGLRCIAVSLLIIIFVILSF